MRSKRDQIEGVQYLTPSQAARILHVSPKTVDRWADRGRVACIVTLGGHRRFSREVIVAVAEEMAGRGSRASSADD